MIAAHGGSLVNLIVDEARAAELKAAAADWPSWDLTPRQICDLELLMNGAFSPLSDVPRPGRLRERLQPDASRRRDDLADAGLLDLPEEVANSVNGQSLALRDLEGVILAVLHVDEVYTPDREAEAQNVFGTTNTGAPRCGPPAERRRTPATCRVASRAWPCRTTTTSGRMRHTPAELRDQFSKLGWTKVVAFQTRNPMHRAHQEITLRAAKESGANLLIHPVVGLTKPGDVDHYTRTRAYQPLLPTYPHNTAALSPVEPGHADGRPPRGGVARHHPQEPRLHPLHRRP